MRFRRAHGACARAAPAPSTWVMDAIPHPAPVAGSDRPGARPDRPDARLHGRDAVAAPRDDTDAGIDADRPSDVEWTLTQELRLEPVQFIAPGGELTASDHPRGYTLPEPDRLLALYRGMVLGRRFDKQATALTKQGRLAVYPSSYGQDACQVATVQALREDDWFFPTYRDSMALVPTLGAAAIIAAGCASQETVVARGLSLRPMQWIGGLSYAIYLWHWPLIILAQAAWPEIRVRHLVLVGLGSIVLAWLTKHLVEDPIRFNPALSAKASRGLAFGGASMAVTAALGLVLHLAAPQLDEDAEVTGATALVAEQQSEEWQVTSDPASVASSAMPGAGGVTGMCRW